MYTSLIQQSRQVSLSQNCYRIYSSLGLSHARRVNSMGQLGVIARRQFQRQMSFDQRFQMAFDCQVTPSLLLRVSRRGFSQASTSQALT